MTAALEVAGVGYSFGARRALDGVSFAVEPGSFTALLGPNGAGKSTLFALATRLFDCREGRIAINGHDLKRQPGQALASLGVAFQQPSLDLDLTVLQNLRFASALHGLGGKAAEARIGQALERLELTGRAHDKARILNGGHRRRVEIARALMHGPALLLLDEPTVGLDVPSRRLLIAQVHALCREDNIAVLWATHLIDEIDPDSDQVVLLHKGKVRAQGSVPQVLAGTGADHLDRVFDRLSEALPCAG
jgi:ABC-2 type transport system ATP-binding protein